jgi:hypothetical protein
VTRYDDFIAAVERHTGRPGKRVGKNVQLLCPAHDDHEPSLDVAEGENGSPLVRCRSRNCTYDDICHAIGHTPADFAPPTLDEWTPRGPAVAVYDYTDADGRLVFQVCRTASKQFPQRRPDPAASHGWRWNLEGVQPVLYRLPRILEAAKQNDVTVYVCEGEKDVHAVERAGGIATCNPGGAGKWRDDYGAAFAGVGRIVVIADNDQPGAAHARKVADSLTNVLNGDTPTVQIVHSLDGKDAADHLAAGHTLDELAPWEVTPLDTQTAPFTITVYTAAALAHLELPEPADPLVGPFLRRGMITLIGGLTGHGKTTWIAQAIKAAALGGGFLDAYADGDARVLVLDLEQHLHSIQRVIREAGLDDTELVDYAPIPEGLALDKRNDQLKELERVFAAVHYDVVVVDPFYKLHESDSSDELAARLLVALLRRWIKEHGFALLTATHCRKLPAGRNTITLDDLFGSSLFTRDPELVLGIQRHGTVTKLHVFKSREPGLEYGQVFEMLFSRSHGFSMKPDKDPAQAAAEQSELVARIVAYVKANPGVSTNGLKKGLKIGLPKLKNALQELAATYPEDDPNDEYRQNKTPPLLGAVRGSRDSDLWYPLNHAALTYPENLSEQVKLDEPPPIKEASYSDLSEPLYKGEGGQDDEGDSDELQFIHAAEPGYYEDVDPPPEDEAA